MVTIHTAKGLTTPMSDLLIALACFVTVKPNPLLSNTNRILEKIEIISSG